MTRSTVATMPLYHPSLLCLAGCWIQRNCTAGLELDTPDQLAGKLYSMLPRVLNRVRIVPLRSYQISIPFYFEYAGGNHQECKY